MAVNLIDSDTVKTEKQGDNLKLKAIVPNKTSQLVNDSNFIADASYNHTDNNYTTSEKNKLSGIENNANNYVLPIATPSTLGGVKQGTNITIAADGTISSTASGGTSDYATLSNKPILNTNNTTTQTISSTETITGTINLHKVAKSGSYNDLLNKPTIPSATTVVQTTGTSTTSVISQNAVTTELNKKVSSTDIQQIVLVDSYPATEINGVLYLKKVS